MIGPVADGQAKVLGKRRDANSCKRRIGAFCLLHETREEVVDWEDGGEKPQFIVPDSWRHEVERSSPTLSREGDVFVLDLLDGLQESTIESVNY